MATSMVYKLIANLEMYRFMMDEVKNPEKSKEHKKLFDRIRKKEEKEDESKYLCEFNEKLEACLEDKENSSKRCKVFENVLSDAQKNPNYSSMKIFFLSYMVENSEGDDKKELLAIFEETFRPLIVLGSQSRF
jgi:hypothetical protein